MHHSKVRKTGGGLPTDAQRPAGTLLYSPLSAWLLLRALGEHRVTQSVERHTEEKLCETPPTLCTSVSKDLRPRSDSLHAFDMKGIPGGLFPAQTVFMTRWQSLVLEKNCTYTLPDASFFLRKNIRKFTSGHPFLKKAIDNQLFMATF